MRRPPLCAALAVLATLAGCGDGEPVPPPPPPGRLVEAARSDGYQWTGIAAAPDGRLFVCMPRWLGPHKDSVVEIRPSGRRRPYPDADSNAWRPGASFPEPASSWVCVQSVRCERDGLYVLDSGNPAFRGILGPAAKLTRFDLANDKLSGRWRFGLPVVETASYLNDVRVDVARQTAYLTDSGLGALVVVDLAAGQARRLLAGHASTMADPAVVPEVQGVRLLRPRGDALVAPPHRIHADGLALDARGDWLYWQALCSRTLWRAPTSVLRDPAASAAAVEAAVERVGETVVADGLEMGPDGTLYLTALEQDAVVARRPDGTLERVASDPRLAWPDSLAIGPRGTLFVTTSQIHRTPLVDGVTAMPKTPYLLFKTGLPPPR